MVRPQLRAMIFISLCIYEDNLLKRFRRDLNKINSTKIWVKMSFWLQKQSLIISFVCLVSCISCSFEFIFVASSKFRKRTSSTVSCSWKDDMKKDNVIYSQQFYAKPCHGFKSSNYFISDGGNTFSGPDSDCPCMWDSQETMHACNPS